MENPQQIRIDDIKDLLSLMIAGNFTFTAKSIKTGHHYTYNIKRSDEYEDVTWDITPDVGYLIMRDNKIEYDFPRSKINDDNVKVFVVIFNLMKMERNHPQLELYRTIKCARCGRRLTDPDSIIRGIGKECEKENFELLTSLKEIQDSNW